MTVAPPRARMFCSVVVMPSVTSCCSASTSLVSREIRTPAPVALVVAHWEPLQVREDVAADVGEDALAGPADEVGLGAGRREPDQPDADERDHDPGQRVEVALGDAVVDGELGQVRRGEAGRHRQQHGDEAERRPALVGRHVAPESADAPQPALARRVLGRRDAVHAGHPPRHPSRPRAPARPRRWRARRRRRRGSGRGRRRGRRRCGRPGRARGSRGRWRSRPAATRGRRRRRCGPRRGRRCASARAMVERRWAMMIVVRPAHHASRSARLMRASVAASTDAVASSRIRMRGSTSRARAIAMRCRCPPESVRPRSPTMVS